MHTILIDQYPPVRFGLIHFLNSRFEGFSFQEYESVGGFCADHPKTDPDLIILGINDVQTKAAIDLVITLKQRCPKAIILVYDDKINLTTNALKYLRAGAAGYLSKSETLQRLEEAVRELINGRRYMAKEMFDAILDQLIATENKKPGNAKLLTPTEYKVAGYLVKGLGTMHIADSLDKRASTISTFKQRIFRKLKVRNVIELSEKMKSLHSS